MKASKPNWTAFVVLLVSFALLSFNVYRWRRYARCHRPVIHASPSVLRRGDVACQLSGSRPYLTSSLNFLFWVGVRRKLALKLGPALTIIVPYFFVSMKPPSMRPSVRSMSYLTIPPFRFSPPMDKLSTGPPLGTPLSSQLTRPDTFINTVKPSLETGSYCSTTGLQAREKKTTGVAITANVSAITARSGFAEASPMRLRISCPSAAVHRPRTPWLLLFRVVHSLTPQNAATVMAGWPPPNIGCLHPPQSRPQDFRTPSEPASACL